MHIQSSGLPAAYCASVESCDYLAVTLKVQTEEQGSVCSTIQ